MITLKQFLACVQENADRIHAYELGHDGSDGKSDCVTCYCMNKIIIH